MTLLRSPAFWNAFTAFFFFASAWLNAKMNNGSLLALNLSIGAMFLSLAAYHAGARTGRAPGARPAAPPAPGAGDQPSGEQRHR